LPGILESARSRFKQENSTARAEPAVTRNLTVSGDLLFGSLQWNAHLARESHGRDARAAFQLTHYSTLDRNRRR
jgi:hypothetical protein